MANDKEVIIKIKIDKNTSEADMAKITKAQQSYSDSISKTGQAIKQINAEKNASNRQLKLEAQLANSATGSYNALSAQYSLNILKLNKMSEKEKENTKQGKALVAKTKDIRTSMIKAKQATGDNTLTVGGYSDGIKEAMAQSGLFGKLLMWQSKIQGVYAAATKASTAATETGTTATKGFGLALKATGIGLIVAAIALLVSAFNSTQAGADSVKRALAPLVGIFESLKGIIQDLAINTIKTWKQEFIIAFDAVALGIAKVRLLWNKLTGDQAEAAEMEKEIEERTNAISTAQTKLNKLSKDGSEIWKGALDRMKDGADIQSKIVDLGIQIEKNDVTLALRKAKINDLLKENQKRSRDSSLSDEERLVAAQKAIDLTYELANADKEQLDLKIQQKTLQNSLNDTDYVAAKELADLKAESIKADTMQKSTEIRLIEQKNTLEKSLAKNRMVAVNEANKGIADYQKKLNEELQKEDDESEDKDFEESFNKELEATAAFEAKKKEILDNIRLANADDDQDREEIRAELDAEKRETALEKMGLDAEEERELKLMLKEQEKQELLDIENKYNKIADKKDKAHKKQLKKAEEDLMNAKVDIAMNGLTAMQMIAGKESTIGKIAAIGKATMNTFLGVSEVWKTPSTLPEPIATASRVASTAVVLGSGLSAVSSIKSQSFANGGIVQGESFTGDNVKVNVNSGEMISNQRQKDNLLLAVANGSGAGGGMSQQEVIDTIVGAVTSIPVVISEQAMTSKQKEVYEREVQFEG